MLLFQSGITVHFLHSILKQLASYCKNTHCQKSSHDEIWLMEYNVLELILPNNSSTKTEICNK